MHPIVKVSVRFGVIAGVLGALLLIGLYYLDRHPFLIPVYFDARIFIFGIFLFFSLKELRDFYQEGNLYFAQALIASFIFVSTYALLSSVMIGVFGTVVPDFVSSYIKLQTGIIKALPPELIERIGKETYNRNLQELPSTNAFDLASLYFMQSYLIGIFVSIILSVILRRQPKI